MLEQLKVPTVIGASEEIEEIEEEETLTEEVKDPTKLLSAYNKVKSQYKEARSAIKELESLKAEKAQKEKEEEENRLKLEGQYSTLAERKIAEVQATFQQQLAERDKQLKKLTQELDAYRTTKETLEKENQTLLETYESEKHQISVKDEFLKAKGKPKMFDYFYNQHRNAFQRNEDGKLVAKLGDEELEPTAFFEKLQEDEDIQAFFSIDKPSGNGGTGSSFKDRSTGSNVRTINASDLTNLKKVGVTLDDIKTGKVKVVY